ncbi:MAG: 30S ribosomal protein S8e [Candidatus Aenigmarchaeota archaeon]|nr:30S ribosomal protein S8e [Candidatus Aenigmarchaeota archaeon]
MAITQKKSKRKLTGGMYKKLRKKKKMDFGKDFMPPKLGEERRKTIDGLARNKKQRLFEVEKVNVFDATGKAKVVDILDVEKNPANPHFVRMRIVTKGAVVKTEMGMVKIVSRPGQHGVLNAVLVKEKK